jgi:rod shape-determining protein MreB
MATPPAHPRIAPKPKATAQAQTAPPPARHSQPPLYMGIDLGTSHSAVVASNGARHVIESYVGWPVDAIARRVVKKPFLIGREALDNRLMLELHRPLEAGYLKEGSDKDLEAVQELLRHLLTLAGVESAPSPRPRVHAVIGVPARALAGQQQQLRNAVQGLVDQVLLVPEPFAVAYGLGALLHTMIIDMGAGTTDFCVLHGRYPTEEERETVAVAGDTIDAELVRLVHERYPDAQVSLPMARAWKEAGSFVGEPAARIIVTVPTHGRPTQVDITEEMRGACELLLPPITHTMCELLARVEPEYQEQVRQQIILAGGSSQIAAFCTSLEHALGQVGGGQVTVVEDPVFAGAQGGLALAVDTAEADWEALAL